MDKVYTNNKGWLKKLDGFEGKRGTLGEFMGKAKDDAGNVYKVFVGSCGLSHCNCGAVAKGIITKTFEITIRQPAIVKVNAENKSEAKRKWWEALKQNNEIARTYLADLLQVKEVSDEGKN